MATIRTIAQILALDPGLGGYEDSQVTATINFSSTTLPLSGEKWIELTVTDGTGSIALPLDEEDEYTFRAHLSPGTTKTVIIRTVSPDDSDGIVKIMHFLEEIS